MDTLSQYPIRFFIATSAKELLRCKEYEQPRTPKSMGAIKKIEEEGNVILVDEDTGAEGEGSTVTVALIDLAINLQKLSDESLPTKDMKNLVELVGMTAETQKRFKEEDVEESDVDDSVEWARKQKR